VPSHHFRYHLFIYETARTSERLVAGSWCSTRPCARMVETCDRSRSGAPISAIIRAPDSRTCPGWRESARPCALVRSRVQVQRQEAGSAADSNAVEAEAYLSSGPSADTDTSLVLLQLPVVTPKSPRVLVRLPGRVHNRACAGAAHQQRFGPPGEQQLSGCRSDRWQLSRNGSRFCGYRAPVACVYLIRGGARPGCVAFSFPCSGIPEKK